MGEQSSTKNIINWMYSTRFEDLPPDVRQMGQLALYDGIGNVLACSMLPVAGRLMGFVRLTGDAPNCTIIGFPQRTSVMNVPWSMAPWDMRMRWMPSMILTPEAATLLPLRWRRR